jgi:hypothetical protein
MSEKNHPSEGNGNDLLSSAKVWESLMACVEKLVKSSFSRMLGKGRFQNVRRRYVGWRKELFIQDLCSEASLALCKQRNQEGVPEIASLAGYISKIVAHKTIDEERRLSQLIFFDSLSEEEDSHDF